MSRCITKEIHCPDCQNVQDFPIWESINADLDPYLKERVLTRELFTFHCKKCGGTFPVTYACLYHDVQQRMMVYLSYGENEDEEMNKILHQMQTLPNYTYRTVRTADELAEKIILKDKGLDDRVIEIIKTLIFIKSINDGVDADSVAGIFYYPGKEGHQIAVFYSDGTQAGLPIEESLIKDTAESLGIRIQNNTKEGYQTVDIVWALKVLEEVKDE